MKKKTMPTDLTESAPLPIFIDYVACDWPVHVS